MLEVASPFIAAAITGLVLSLAAAEWVRSPTATVAFLVTLLGGVACYVLWDAAVQVNEMLPAINWWHGIIPSAIALVGVFLPFAAFGQMGLALHEWLTRNLKKNSE